MKIIFDRSAFHRERFDLLKGSHLAQLVQKHKILVYHTSVFLEETLRMAVSTKQGAKDELRRQWPFLVSICNGGWFKPLLFGQPQKLKSVCDEELDRDDSRPLVPSKHRSAIEAKVARFLEESGPLPELDNAQPIHDQNEQVKKENKTLRFELRKKPTGPRDETFLEFYQSCIVEAASLFIHRPAALGQLQVRLAPLDQPQVK